MPPIYLFSNFASNFHWIALIIDIKSSHFKYFSSFSRVFLLISFLSKIGKIQIKRGLRIKNIEIIVLQTHKERIYMKDINTAIFLLILGIILLFSGLFAPIHSIEIRWLVGILSIPSFYTSYVLTAKNKRQENMIRS